MLHIDVFFHFTYFTWSLHDFTWDFTWLYMKFTWVYVRSRKVHVKSRKVPRKVHVKYVNYHVKSCKVSRKVCKVSCKVVGNLHKHSFGWLRGPGWMCHQLETRSPLEGGLCGRYRSRYRFLDFSRKTFVIFVSARLQNRPKGGVGWKNKKSESMGKRMMSS